MQIYNGLYQSVVNKPSTGSGYLDYNLYYGNTSLDYSTISTGQEAYRFATFVWNFPGTDGALSFSNFVFKFYNFKCAGSIISLNSNESTGTYYFSNNDKTQRFFLHYRVEEYTNIDNIKITPGASNASTIWIDGNTKLGTTLTSGTAQFSNEISNPASVGSGPFGTGTLYNTPNDNTIVRAANPASYSYDPTTTTLTATVGSAIYGPRAKKYYIYCRLGLPMIDNYSFEYAGLNFSS